MRAVAAAPWALECEGKGGRSSASRVYVHYDNYDRCELRSRNYDAPVMTLRRSLGLAVGFMKQCCRVLPQGRSGVQVHNSERARHRRQNKASCARISQADIRARCCSHLEAARDRPGTG